MSVVSKLTGAEFDSMVDRGAFNGLSPRKIELIRGELRFMNPAGPVHDDYIEFLTHWSVEPNLKGTAKIRVSVVSSAMIIVPSRMSCGSSRNVMAKHGRLRPMCCC